MKIWRIFLVRVGIMAPDSFTAQFSLSFKQKLIYVAFILERVFLETPFPEAVFLETMFPEIQFLETAFLKTAFLETAYLGQLF